MSSTGRRRVGRRPGGSRGHRFPRARRPGRHGGTGPARPRGHGSGGPAAAGGRGGALARAGRVRRAAPHEEAKVRLTGRTAGKDCARLAADTRLAAGDWRLCATAEQFLALVSRCDLVVTTRLHGLVPALRTGTPVIAVDPVSGGAKVGAQARAVGRPALVDAGAPSEELLDHWWRWALSRAGRTAAARHMVR
ncbi:polysaccharide pyruvyl transferase family protein [Streptomyces barringtoniae]|uniref:polysaccharide pyruvyl transferase family protein n=1 Tax=Streptomyces barringtoniae TaxID=2892029 RepID=UPI001E5059C8|nr:polysaccharide pyruvyl transferase family protein [Streptomyces barringtoniae]MCC5477959.1 polysaccharide pyruvyl transferase family protein [Streptomyces barringtoniae]